MNLNIKVKELVEKRLQVNHIKITFDHLEVVLNDGNKIELEPESSGCGKCWGIAYLENGKLDISTGLKVVKSELI